MPRSLARAAAIHRVADLLHEPIRIMDTTMSAGGTSTKQHDKTHTGAQGRNAVVEAVSNRCAGSSSSMCSRCSLLASPRASAPTSLFQYDRVFKPNTVLASHHQYTVTLLRISCASGASNAAEEKLLENAVII